MAELVTSGQVVLLVWGASPPPSNMENYVNNLRTQTGQNGFVQVENAEILLQCEFTIFLLNFDQAKDMICYNIHNRNFLASYN